MFSMEASHEREMRSLVASMTEQLAAERARAEAAERIAETLQGQINELHLKLDPAEIALRRLELEKGDVQKQLDRSLAKQAELQARCDRQARIEADTHLGLQRISTATEDMFGVASGLLLRAQDVASNVPTLQVVNRSHAKRASDEAEDAEEAQRWLLQANFEAAVNAFLACSEQHEELADAAMQLREPLATLRDAVRMTTGASSAISSLSDAAAAAAPPPPSLPVRLPRATASRR